MPEDKSPKFTEETALAEDKKQKSTAIWNALLIGIFVGVIIYGVAKNNIGFFGLIPLYFLFKWINISKANQSQKH